MITVGEVYESLKYGSFRIVQAKDSKDIDIEFINTGCLRNVRSSQIYSGDIKDPTVPTILGVGYFGQGYTETIHKDMKKISWQCWKDMLKRCYDHKTLKKRPSYIGCSVADCWLNFQNFSRFYCENNYREEGWQLDKDLLVRNNRIYSESTCVFLPRSLNGLIITNKSCRGKYPIGVTYAISNSKFKAGTVVEGKQVCLGFFDTPEEAFYCYKTFKEALIKEKANFWKDKIHPLAYKALMEYEVDIED
jgi:Bacillus phage HNH endonuclease